jgi:hypothetical protein
MFGNAKKTRRGASSQRSKTQRLIHFTRCSVRVPASAAEPQPSTDQLTDVRACFRHSHTPFSSLFAPTKCLFTVFLSSRAVWSSRLTLQHAASIRALDLNQRHAYSTAPPPRFSTLHDYSHTALTCRCSFISSMRVWCTVLLPIGVETHCSEHVQMYLCTVEAGCFLLVHLLTSTLAVARSN